MRSGQILFRCAVLLALVAAARPAMAGVVVDIPNNAVVTGTILEAGDADEYRFDVTAKSGLGINVKTDPGVFVDLGLALLAPSGVAVDLTTAQVYRDRFRWITIGGLRVTETGTYRLFVTAAEPCAYRLKLSTTPCEAFGAVRLLPPGGEILYPVSAPAHSRLRIRAEALVRSRAKPRLMQIGPFDLSQAGLIRPRFHRVMIPDSGETRDFVLRVRDLSGRGGRTKISVAVGPPEVPRAWLDTRDQTEIVSITPGDGTVHLAWLPTLDADSYTVYWSTTPGVGEPGNPGTAIPGIAAPEFTHTGLVNGLTYYYTVTATCALHQERERCRERWAALRPDPPGGIVATAGDGVVDLSWDAATGADFYRIYWSTAPGFQPPAGSVIDGLTGTAYTHTGRLNGETYFYILTAVGAGGESQPSATVPVALAPGEPTSISAAAGDGVVTISWSDSYGATSYNLYRGTEDGVSRATGELIAGVTSPHADTTVVNGTMYYYVATAVGDGGESPESSQVAARPLPTPEAPLNVAATVTEEAPNSLTVTWDPPLVGADSYTIYWSTTPGVTIGTNPIPGVVSPFVHTGLSGRTAYYYIVTSTLFGEESEASYEVSATPRGSATGGGDTGYGNNLSFPVLFADGRGITGAALGTNAVPYLDTATGMRPTDTDVVDPFPYFDPADAVVLNLVTYYPQQAASTWQADWVDGSFEEQDVVVDWGDNLRSQSFRTTSVVRVETTLVQDTTLTAPEDTLTAYVMALLEGSGTTELQGTSGETYESNVRTVYTVHPRLLIEKLTGMGGPVDASVPGIELSVAESFGTDGSGGYGAEVNVGGKLVYGYVWMLNTMSLTDEQKRGWWRITFALDPLAAIGTDVVYRHTVLAALDPADVGPTTGIAADGTHSWIEVQVR